MVKRCNVLHHIDIKQIYWIPNFWSINHRCKLINDRMEEYRVTKMAFCFGVIVQGASLPHQSRLSRRPRSTSLPALPPLQ